MMTQTVGILKVRMYKLEQKDPVENARLIAKLKRQIRKLESQE